VGQKHEPVDESQVRLAVVNAHKLLNEVEKRSEIISFSYLAAFQIPLAHKAVREGRGNSAFQLNDFGGGSPRVALSFFAPRAVKTRQFHMRGTGESSTSSQMSEYAT
jgi:hypothetical protein